MIGTPPPTFPMLDLESFRLSTKFRKPQFTRRIFSSPMSEDWVTWNVFRLLGRRPASVWWPKLIEVAQAQCRGDLDLPDPTVVDLWVPMRAPVIYEAASRARMAASDDQAWVLRATDPNPVEGVSEIDVVIRGPGYQLLAEAKLLSDISRRTTYDPLRNQIVRNIDCALESPGTALPLFWMFVKDRSPVRIYSQLIDAWKEDPGLLASALPHRNAQVISDLIDRCAIVTWAEILSAIDSIDPDEEDVWVELQKRIA